MKKRPVLETTRLLLRPFELSDAADLQRLAGDKAIADTTLNIPYPYQDGAAEEWISAHPAMFRAGEAAIFAIVLRSTGELIGAIGLVVEPRFERAELGYWIARPEWSKGYCTEAASALVRYGFSVLGLNRIHAAHLSRNPASGRVMEKLGMTHEGRARRHAKKWDRFEDLELYGLLRDEWEGMAMPIEAGRH